MGVIEKIEIDGFRGIREPTNLRMHEGLNVLYGPNGIGKSSVIQAIEWCLTGNIRYFSGGDFRKEDAIVNLFSPSRRASVKIQIKEDEGQLEVARTRSMRKTSSPGTQPLVVDYDGDTYRNEDAYGFISSTLGIDVSVAIKNIVLSQEMIRESLSAKPTEQSRSIDRLLGTLEIREFAEALDPKRQISNVIRELTQRTESLERDRVQFTVRLRQQLDEERGSLLSQGYDNSELSLETAYNGLRELVSEVGEMASSLSAPSPVLRAVEPKVDSLISILSEVENSLGKLERFRVDALSNIQTRLLRLQNLESQYISTSQQMQRIGDVQLEVLEKQQSSLIEQLSETTRDLDSVRHAQTSLSSQKASIESANEKVKSLREEISNVIEKYGEPEDHSRLISDLETRNTAIDGEVSKKSLRSQLASLAIDYLEGTKPQTCPVCDKELTPEEVVVKLKTLVKGELFEEIAHLRAEKESNKAKILEIEEATREIQRLSSERNDWLSRIRNIYSELSKKLEKKVDESFDLDKLIKGHEESAVELAKKVTSISNEISAIKARIDEPTKLRRALDRIIELIKEEIELKSTESVEKRLKEGIASLLDDKKLLEVTEHLDQAQGKLARLRKIVDFLRSQEKLEQLEKELPKVTEEVKALRKRVDYLEMLEGRLMMIRESVVEYQREAVNREMETLEDDVNNYYSTIQGHPFFTKLIVEIEKEFPIQYAFKAINPAEGTSSYIVTRFSQAQMNVAAIAIFLSNNKRLTGNLPLLILDDPTQSMDEAHKESLATLLNDLSRSRQVIIATQDENFNSFLQAKSKDINILELET